MNVILEPSKSSRMLAWVKTSSTINVDKWQIDILKEENVNGQTIYQPQVQYFQSKNYIRINPKYMTDEFYYHIYGLDQYGNIVIDKGDNLPVAPNNNVFSVCYQKCNGDDYAYKISQHCQANGGCYLSFDQAVAWTANNITVPYYWYVSLTTWDSWSLPGSTNPYLIGYDIIHFNTNHMPNGFFVKNKGGTGLTGNVVGIEKKLGIYQVYSAKITGNLASQLDCQTTISDFKSIFYQNKLNCNDANVTYPNIGCIPDPNTWTFSDGKPVHTTDPTAHPSDGIYIEFDYFWDLNGDSLLHPCYPNYPGSCLGTEGTFSFSEVNSLLESSTDGSLNTTLDASNFTQFEFQKVGDSDYSLILLPSSIEQMDGSLSLAGQTFNDGLYKLNVYYSDNTIIPVYFESITGSGSSTTLLSSYFSANIFQVPIINNEFSVVMTSLKDMDFVYEIFDLNGNLLEINNYQIKTGEEIFQNINIDPSLYLLNNMLVNKFTFTDGSTLVIQTIKTIN